MSNKVIHTTNKVNIDYIWKSESHYFKRATFVNDYKDGGLQAIDLDFINGL